jgi:hypothetical protein
MLMQVGRNTGTSYATLIHSDIEALGITHFAQYPHRFLRESTELSGFALIKI